MGVEALCVMTVPPVEIGGIMVGEGYPTVLVAEVGTFFNNDIALAENYLGVAAEAGIQFFKTEVLHSPEVCLRNTGATVEYNHAHGSTSEDYRALVERKVVSLDDYERLFARCSSLGVQFLATVYDIEGVDFLAQIGAAGIKISRDNIDNFPLIRYASATGLPLVFDVEGVRLDEPARALRTATEAGKGGVVMNYHPGSNPAPAALHNLKILNTFRSTFQVPVGLSCHYRGEEIMYAAVGVGANVLEKGIVDDPDRSEQDLVTAVPLQDVPHILDRIRCCWEALGDGLPQSEAKQALSSRRCLVAKRAIVAGEALGLQNVSFAWPPLGISVEHWDIAEGMKLVRPVEQYQPVSWTDLGVTLDEASGS